MSARGWTSAGLKVVGDDDKHWTMAQAACLLGPPQLSVTQVRQLVALHRLEPAGKRRTTPHGQSGRYARVYKASDLIRAYDALSRHH